MCQYARLQSLRLADEGVLKFCGDERAGRRSNYARCSTWLSTGSRDGGSSGVTPTTAQVPVPSIPETRLGVRMGTNARQSIVDTHNWMNNARWAAKHLGARSAKRMLVPTVCAKWISTQNHNLPLIALLTLGTPKMLVRGIYAWQQR